MPDKNHYIDHDIDHDIDHKCENLWEPGMDREFIAAEVRSKRNNSIGYLLAVAQKQTMAMLADRLAPLGVTPAQWQALVVLWEEDGIVQREIAERMVIEQATLTRTLDRMERDGFVERRPDEHDRRRTRVFVTEKGFGLINTLVPEAMEVLTTITNGFSDDEINVFRSFLRRLIGNISPTHTLAEHNINGSKQNLDARLNKGAAE
ncbi:MAG: MarR family transcriptional regulator [Rhodospirillaceae bacterium]|nr:MarR family transcriptional regulator [Rhodospirillaceae bacterium]